MSCSNIRRISLLVTLALLSGQRVASADIYQWEYIDPQWPSLGKQQSTTLVPDGAGVSAVPGALLNDRNLTKGYFIGANVAGANFYNSNLTNADLSGANISGANLGGTRLDSAVLQNADLSNASLSQANLTGATLAHSDLTAADFSNANLTNATISGGLIKVHGANFTGAIITGANLLRAVTDGGAAIGYGGFTAAQLYSTASYGLLPKK